MAFKKLWPDEYRHAVIAACVDGKTPARIAYQLAREGKLPPIPADRVPPEATMGTWATDERRRRRTTARVLDSTPVLNRLDLVLGAATVALEERVRKLERRKGGSPTQDWREVVKTAREIGAAQKELSAQRIAGLPPEAIAPDAPPPPPSFLDTLAREPATNGAAHPPERS